MPLVAHLGELRRRLVISLLALTGGAVVAFIFYNHILDLLLEPYCNLPRDPNQPCSLFISDPLEGFTTRLKVSTWTGFLVGSPVIFYQIWRFITPGLHPNEKRYAVPFVISSIVLFTFGVLLAWITFPRALDFLVAVGGPNLTTIFSPTKYLRLVLLMFFAFGVAFEFPVLLVFLQLAGVLSSARLSSWRRPAIVLIVLGAAVITPSQDPWSLLAMSLPMYIFYEGSIIIGRLLKK
jgi:sec-independent protein translocase protein TatC